MNQKQMEPTLKNMSVLLVVEIFMFFYFIQILSNQLSYTKCYIKKKQIIPKFIVFVFYEKRFGLLNLDIIKNRLLQ